MSILGFELFSPFRNGLVFLFAAGFIAADSSIMQNQGSKPLRRVLDAFDRGVGPKRIVLGGVVASIADHPWQVGLVAARVPDNYRAQFCGGSIIGERWVLTAAHCVDQGTEPGQIEILAGTISLEVGGIRFPARSIKVHDAWNPDTSDSDIALIEVVGPLPAKSIISAVSTDGLRAGREIAITGWGAIAWRDPKGSKLLLQAMVPFVPRSSCNLPSSYAGQITDNMICAGKREGAADACQGDSGGPATMREANRPRLVGVISWGEGCGWPNKYGVYTRVSNFSAWVRRETAGEVSW